MRDSPKILDLLASFREVNRLILHSHDLMELASGACRVLKQSREVDMVWLALSDPDGAFINAVHEGVPIDRWKRFKESLGSQQPPPCYRQALEKDPMVRLNPDSACCQHCPILPERPDRQGLSFRLETQNRMYGVLGISAPIQCADDQLEVELFRELSLQLALGCEAIRQRREQAETRKQLELQALLLRRISDFVLATDLEGTILYVNDTYAERLRTSPDELLGKSLEVLGEEVERGNTHQEVLENTLKHGNWRTEVVNRLPHGEEMILDCRTGVMRDENNQPAGLVGISTDITEFRRSENALRENREWLSRIIEHAPYGILIADGDQHYLQANPEAVRILGRSEEELLQLKVPDVLIPEHRDIARKEFKNLRAGEPAAGELTALRPDGTARETRFKSLPFGSDRYLCFVEDITDQNRLRQQFQQAQKMESVGRLAGGVAHDFNNLLMGILGCADILEVELEPGHSAHRWVNDIRREVERSADLIRQLLTFARKQPSQPQVLDINLSLESMRKMLSRLIGENIRMEWKPYEPLWRVRLDPSQLDQVVVNLIVNARDAIADVGTLTLETKNCSLADGDLELVADVPAGDYVRLSVSDTGKGMDPETLTKVFDPFFTTKSAGKGTGLGLAVVYGVLQQHQGFVRVESTVGVGSSFHLYFPRVAEPEPEKNAENSKSGEMSGGTETLLLVEDEEPIRTTLAMILRHVGYTVLTAAGPQEALVLLQQHSHEVALMLTDVVMPEMNGRELAEKVFAIYPDIRVVYMSGYDRNVLDHDDLKHGDINFVSKPCTASELTSVLRNVLDRK